MTSVTNSSNSLKAPNPAKLISDERRNTKFDPLLMHQFLEGSAEKSQQILELYQSLERDVFLSSTFGQYDDSELAERERVAKRINEMSRYLEIEEFNRFWRRLNLITVYDPSLGIRISINLGLFLNCIRGNGTDSQFHYWSNIMESGKIKQLYGCFGMTELAHGSNVTGLETTATFDKETDEFIINTPHIGATKWWIGGAAHSATHCTVYARLIVDGEDYGVKTFVVPLRDSNHELNPGVAVGDIGAKMGRKGVDNGWIQFSGVRIPRFFMLQKWCKVSRDGEVTLPPLEQLSYISLLGGRVFMATDSYRICARFITIAIRYGICRVQFKSHEEDESEVQLLNYPLHQRRLLPYLALTYAMAVGTNKLELSHEEILKNLEISVKNNDRELINKSIIDTKSLFVDSGSLKSTLTWLAADCINETRQACGGHGYSSYNGFGKAYNDWVVQCTWEGDNNVLGMSVGRTIIKNVDDVIKKGRRVSGSMEFLNNAKQYISNEIILTENDLDNPQKVLKGLEILIIRISYSMIELLKENKGDWDSISYQRNLLSKLRCHQYLLVTFIDQLSKVTDENIFEQLNNILKLYSLSSILESYSNEFLLNNILKPTSQKIISTKLIPGLFKKIRPSVIPLTDSFQQSDNFLNSAIGSYDGNIYENYFRIVKESNPPFNTKAPYSAALEAMLNRPSKDTRERFEKVGEAAEYLSK